MSDPKPDEVELSMLLVEANEMRRELSALVLPLLDDHPELVDIVEVGTRLIYHAEGIHWLLEYARGEIKDNPRVKREGRGRQYVTDSDLDPFPGPCPRCGDPRLYKVPIYGSAEFQVFRKYKDEAGNDQCERVPDDLVHVIMGPSCDLFNDLGGE